MPVSSRSPAYAILAAIWLLHIGSAAQAESEIKSEVKAVFDQATSAYAHMKSYQHTEITSREQAGEKYETKLSLTMDRPNKIRCVSDAGKAFHFMHYIATSDGKTFIEFLHIGQIQQYIRKSAPAQYTVLLNDLHNSSMTGDYLIAMMFQGNNPLADAETQTLFTSSALGSNVERYGAQWQVVCVIDRFQSLFEFYFNKKTHLLDKWVVTDDMGNERSQTLTNIQINRPIPASAFAFTPPAGAKQVQQFHGEVGPKAREPVPPDVKFEGKQAANFTLKDLDGKEVSLSAFRGKIVVMDFWTSQFGPGHSVLPPLQKIHDDLADQGVVVLVIDSWDGEEPCRAFFKAHPNYTMTVLVDPAHEDKQSVAVRLYGVSGLPSTLIIDRKGKISKYFIGGRGDRDYADYLSALQALGVDTASRKGP